MFIMLLILSSFPQITGRQNSEDILEIKSESGDDCSSVQGEGSVATEVSAAATQSGIEKRSDTTFNEVSS